MSYDLDAIRTTNSTLRHMIHRLHHHFHLVKLRSAVPQIRRLLLSLRDLPTGEDVNKAPLLLDARPSARPSMYANNAKPISPLRVLILVGSPRRDLTPRLILIQPTRNQSIRATTSGSRASIQAALSTTPICPPWGAMRSTNTAVSPRRKVARPLEVDFLSSR